MIFFLAPPPNGIVPAHQTSVYSYSVQQHPSLLPSTLNGVSGQYQPQYQATHPPHSQAAATMTASQLPTNDHNPEPPVAHQASSDVTQCLHDPLKTSQGNEFGIKQSSKRQEPPKAHHNVQNTSIAKEKPLFTHNTQQTSKQMHTIVDPIKSQNPDVIVLETDKNMHKRAEDLAGKISATVTITTNSTSKLFGGNAREKNDFLSTPNNASSGGSKNSKEAKQGVQPTNKESPENGQQFVPQIQIGGKTLLDPNKIVPNLSNLKPIPPTNSNAQSFMPNIASQPSSMNPSALMATITPIYTPMSSAQESSKAFVPITTKSSLRDYRKPRVKSVQAQGQIFKTSTNASTNNRFSIPVPGDKNSPLVPDEISVTTVIGPPGNKMKAGATSHHQEPAIISCYPVTKSTNNGGSTKRHMSGSSDASTTKKMKNSSAQPDKHFPFPKGLTITEVNVPSIRQQQDNVGLMINPLNVCATTLDQHQHEDDDDVIPVLHIPETTNISKSESSISKYRGVHQKSSMIGKTTGSKIPSGISNIRPLLQTQGSRAGLTASGHPGMPSGLLRMTATSLQQKSFQSQLNIPKVSHNFLSLHPRPSATGSNSKINPKDTKSRMALNKISVSSEMVSSNISKNNRLTLKPPKTNVPATITMSMAESAVSAVQPTTFKPVPVRSKSYSANSKQSMTGFSASPTKKGSQVSSPSSSRSSSRNSSLSPRDRSGSMSNKGNNSSSGMSPKISFGSMLSSGGGTSSPKGPNSTKKKTSIVGYDPKAPLVPWHIRNGCSPKTCNGWDWEGEGKVQKVYLNVSSSFYI